MTWAKSLTIHTQLYDSKSFVSLRFISLFIKREW